MADKTYRLNFTLSDGSAKSVQFTAPQGEKGGRGDTGAAGKDGKSAYQYAKDGGFEGTEEEFSEKLASSSGYLAPAVMDYGAKGDGTTDDTTAFQTALAENRVVFVPGGTYKLSGTLVIGENCCMELSQDTVLQFTQTSGNCIDMRGSATLRGNHAIITVPYGFTGHVVAIDTSLETGDLIIPPYKKIGSHMFKRQRFVYDVNIIKPDASGFCRSDDGKCSGTAVYMCADHAYPSYWMWALSLSGIRIAGAFSYGVRAVNYDSPVGSEGHYEDDAWNHDMRIEAVIEACEIGVALENCNCAHLNVTIQPALAMNDAKYAKYGFYLNDAKAIDMTGSRVWDWDADRSLWTAGGQYQHIALIGNCTGLVLSDYLYYWSSADIRDLIYTNTPSNLEKMVILQEPVTRWFKPVDNKPYFFDGNGNKQLAMKSDVDEYFITDRIAQFTNVLENNIDKNGNVYGTADGFYNSNFTSLTVDAIPYHKHTGFIACKKGDVFITDGIGLRDDGCVRVAFFDAAFNYITHVNGGVMMKGNYYVSYQALEAGFKLTINNVNDGNINKIAYARFNFNILDMGENPVMSVNDEIKWEQVGFLADDIKVKAENVVGNTVLTSPNGKRFVLAVSDSGTLSATAIT